MEKFKELLEKYNKTESDITFEYEGLSDEELETKFKETFGETEPEAIEDHNSTEFENMTRSFELSHSDIRYALYQLLVPYEEADNEFYWISAVYDSYFVYEGYSDKIYRQNYTKDNDANTVTFEGERVELFRELLTASEKTELESIRANYESLKQFKEDTENKELHAKREELINSDKYSVLAEKNDSGEYVNEKFAELVKNMDNYSLTDLETQIKVIHSDFVSESSNFESHDSGQVHKNIPMRVFSNPNDSKKKTSRYGNLKFN